jgi:hypothetical protein
MQDNNTTAAAQLFAVRYPEVVTRVGFFTPTDLANWFGGADVADLVANPAAVEGIIAATLDLSDQPITERTAIRVMTPQIGEIGTALAAGWPAMFIAEQVLADFLGDENAYALPAAWQATAAGVAELVETLIADPELLAESGVLLADGWKLTEATGQSGTVCVTVQHDGDAPVVAGAINERELIGLTKETGVGAAIAALTYLAFQINVRAAVQVYATADAAALEAALTAGAPAPSATAEPQITDGISYERLAEILRTDAEMDSAEVEALIELIQLQANG